MPYVGRDLQRGNYLKLDDISSSFDGSTTTFNLQSGGSAFYPGSAFSIFVSVGGVIQEPESAYTINKNTITFANAPHNVDECFITALGVALGVGVPGHGTVNGSQLAKPFNYDGGLLYLDSTNDRVGVGVTTPSYTLDVNGTANFSGNVTVGGTLTYQDVASIDAVGIATFQDDVNFNGTGAGISSAFWDKSANEFKFKDGVKLSFGDSQDLEIYHDGSTNYIRSNNGDLVLRDDTIKLKAFSTTDTYLEATNGGAVTLRHDNDIIFNTDKHGVIVTGIGTFSGGVKIPDDKQLTLGTDNNLYIKHSNGHANNFVVSSVGDIEHHMASSKKIIKGFNNSGTPYVNLYHNNNIRLTTTIQGTKITGGADTILLVEGTSTASRIDLKTSSHHRFWQTLESDGRFRLYDQTNAAERLCIDSSGRLLVGHTSTIDTSTYNSKIQVMGADAAASITVGRFGDNASASSIHLTKSRNGTVGNHGSGELHDNDVIGNIFWWGSDGGDYEEVARISAEAEAAFTGSSTPGALTFRTTAVNATTATERLRIDSAGMTGVRTAVPRATLHVKAHDNNWEGGLLLEDNTGSDGWNFHPESSDASLLIGYNDDTSLALTSQSASVALKLKSDGNVIIGNFTPVDTRNTGGIHIQDNHGISFKSHSSGASRNWRIRNDDFGWGNLDFGVGTSNSDFADAAGEIVLSLASSRRVGINEVAPDAPLHITGGLPHIRLENSGTSASAGDTFGQIDFKHNDSDDAGVTAAIKCIAEDNAGNSFLAFHNGDGGNAGESFRIDSSACVRVGNTAIQTTSGNTKRIALGGKGSIWGWVSGQIDGSINLADNYYWDGANNRAIEAADAAYLALRLGSLRFGTTDSTPSAGGVTGLTEKFRITSAGKLILSPNINQTTAFDYAGVYFSSDNSTVADGLFLNNAAGNTGDNVSLSFSTDSGNRKKSAISHVDTGAYGRGDLVFSIDPDADSGSLDIQAHEKLRIHSSGRVLLGTTSGSQGQLNIKNANDFSTASISTNTDNIYLISDATSGDGVYGASIGFSRVQYADRRAAAIATVQAGSDEDNVGLAFFTHPGTDANDPVVEKLRITSGGNVNIGGNYTQTTYTMRVTGSFAATTKSFVIDHPTKENHKLRYACLEGPENSVYVRGRSSDSVIELPDYWVGLVHDDSITVNVTPIGNKNVWVESINNNSVTIGSDDSTEYFYTVFAERKDVEKLEVEVEN